MAFHGDTIFLEGQFHEQFEDVAVYEKGWFSDTKVWIDIPSLENDSADVWQGTNNKTIRVVGIYNAKDTGHLGKYNGALDNISYLWID